MAHDMSMKDFWDSRSTTYDAQFDRAPVRLLIMQEIGRQVPPSLSVAHVLDLGAGTGRLTEYLKLRLPHARFSLVDFSPRMLALARTRLAASPQCEFHEADMRRLPIASQSIDLVVSACVLHHVDDEAKRTVVGEVARVLRPGGVAVVVDEAISDPALTNDPSALDRRMREVFYPEEDQGQLDQTFAGLKEWPSEASRLQALFCEAGLEAERVPLNDIVVMIMAVKPIVEGWTV